MADTTARILLSASDQTKAAFTAVGRNLSAMQGTLTGLHGKFTSLGTVVTGVLATIGAARGIAMLDQLDDLAEKTGLSVEKLSELRYAGEAVGTPLETLAGGLGRLSKLMAEAASGNTQASATFNALGVSVKNSDGTLRSSDEVLGDLADRFSKYKDGAGKAAQAQSIFGKSGAEMIPLLNLGRAGIQELSREAQNLGAIYSGDVAKDAAQFNDTLAKLKIHAEAAAISVGGPLLKSLNRLLLNYLELKKLGSLDLVVGDAVKGFFGKSRLSNDPESDIHRLLAERRKLEEQLSKGSSAFFDQDKRSETEEWASSLKDVNRLLTYTEGRLERARAESFSSKAVLWGGPGRGKEDDRRDMPGLGNASAGDQADTMARKIMDRETKDIRAGAEERKQAIEFSNALAKAAYEDGYVTLQAHHEAMATSRAAALQSELDALDAEARAVRDYMAKVSKPTEKADAQTRLQEIASKRAEAVTKAGQNAITVAREEGMAIEELQRRYADFQAQVADSRGDMMGAAAPRIRQEVASLQTLLRQAGKSPSEATDYGERLTQQVRLNEVQRDYALLVERAAMTEEAALLSARERGASELETLRAIGASRQSALGQMGEMVARARELADALGTPEVKAYADQLALAFKRAVAEVDPLLTKLRDVGAEAAGAISDGLADGALAGKSLVATLKDIDKQLTQIALNELFTKPLKGWLTNAIGGNGQASGGGGLLGSLAGVIGKGAAAGTSAGATGTGDATTDLLTGLAKSAATSSANSSWVDSLSSWFSGLASFDVGTSYVPHDMVAKVHEGERILTREENRRGWGSSMNVNISQSFAPGTDRSTTNQAARDVAAALQRAQRFR